MFSCFKIQQPRSGVLWMGDSDSKAMTQQNHPPPQCCTGGHLEKQFLMKVESYRPISFLCIKPQGFLNFPTLDFHSTIFPDGFQLESSTERFNNILHSILKCTVMLMRRKEKYLHGLLIKYKENYGRQNFPLCSTWQQLSIILTLGLF